MWETPCTSCWCAHGCAPTARPPALVCAPEQARRAQRILPLLTAEEETVFKRGRNAAVHAIPKNATTAQYHQATALECLLGWLYLRGDTDRVSALFDVMMEEN